MCFFAVSLQYLFFVIFCNKFMAAPLAKRSTNPSCQLVHSRNTRGEPELIIAQAQLFVMHVNHINTVKSPLVDSPNIRAPLIKWTICHAWIELCNTNKPRQQRTPLFKGQQTGAYLGGVLWVLEHPLPTKVHLVK